MSKKNRQSRLRVAIALALFLAGVYLLVLAFWPQAEQAVPRDWNKPVETSLKENRLYLPRLKLNLEYKTGDASVLLDHVWHRHPKRGDPARGGNFILAGHRFEIGFTPAETRRRSPFYHLGKVQEGDYIYADFNKKRYQYVVTKKYTVKPAQVEIEAPSPKHKITLYTCTLRGQADGREVLEGRLVGRDIDPDQKMKSSKD